MTLGQVLARSTFSVSLIVFGTRFIVGINSQTALVRRTNRNGQTGPQEDRERGKNEEIAGEKSAHFVFVIRRFRFGSFCFCHKLLKFEVGRSTDLEEVMKLTWVTLIYTKLK
ncbi:hypothetical protein GWI33_016404 [Rhynchophorus ferrugineus]|uniref:Uncharacterized protein n=1 Tax=Rhynchophorus ferrugineus TaxID=354439 RepID=A0A834I190_RHYFE|nr:hypothetical protein GWI33_016404 [Rhynchophorus ferrugineus]